MKYLGEMSEDELVGTTVRSLTGKVGTVVETRDVRDLEVVIEWNDGTKSIPFFNQLAKVPSLVVLNDD